MKVYRKTNFTLIEVMICVLLLLMTASFFSYKLTAILSRVKAQKNIKTLCSHIELCKHLAYLEQSDVTLSLQKKNDTLYCKIATQGGRGVIAYQKPLQEKFKHVTFAFGKNTSQLELNFSASGTVFPEGTLVLKAKDPSVKKSLPIKSAYQSDREIKEEYPLHPKECKEFSSQPITKGN